MANTFLTANLIARESLPILQNNTVMPNLVHTDYSNTFQNAGDTIQVRKPAVFTAVEFDGDLTGEYQAISETSVTVQLDTIASVDVEVTAKELTLSVEDFNAQITQPAMVALAEKIDSDLTSLYVDVPYYYGTSGTTPDALADLAGVRKILMNNKCPNDNMKNVVIDEEAEAAFLALDALVNVDKSGASAALRDASLGKVYKMSIYMDQNIKTHTAGTFTAVATPLTNGTIAAAATTLTLDGGAASETLLVGDILTIAGQQYTVTANATASTGAISVSVYPAVPAEIADGTAVTFPDKTALAHTANLAFHKNAFALVNRPLMAPMGGADSYSTSAQGVINVRVTMDYDMNTKKNIISYDVLYGTKTLYPELAARLLG